MEKFLRDLREQLAYPAGVVGLQVLVVDEEHENPSRHIISGLGRRQDDAFGWRRGRREQRVGYPPTGDDRHRADILKNAVLVDFKIRLLQVRDEVSLLVPNQ